MDGERLSTNARVTAVSCNDVYSFSKPGRPEIMLIAGLGVAGDVHAGVRVRHRSRVAADPDQPNLRQVHLIRSELHEELVEAGYEVPAGGLGENVTTAGIDLLGLPVGTVLRFGPRNETAGSGPREEADAGPGARDAGPGARDAGPGAREAGPGAREVGPGARDAGPGAREDAGARSKPREGAAAVLAAAQRVQLDDSASAAVAALADRIAAEPPHDHRPAVVVMGLRNPCQQINDYRSGLLKRVLVREPDGSVSRRAGVMAVVLRGGLVRPGAEIEVELPALPHRALDRV